MVISRAKHKMLCGCAGICRICKAIAVFADRDGETLAEFCPYFGKAAASGSATTGDARRRVWTMDDMTAGRQFADRSRSQSAGAGDGRFAGSFDRAGDAVQAPCDRELVAALGSGADGKTGGGLDSGAHRGAHAGAHDGPPRPLEVEGPLGQPLTLASLPPPDTRRWVVRRKAEVLSAINGGLLTAAEACARYRLSPEELELWQASIDRAGMPGLRVTRIQLYRDYPVARAPARSSASSGFVPTLAWQA